MSAKQNKEILHKAVDEYNKGNTEALYKIHADNHVYHASGGLEITNKQAFIELDKLVRITFPDQQVFIEDLIAEGEMVAWREIFRATFKGAYQGIPPTGKKVELTAICIQRFDRGKIIESWVARDILDMLQQMGITPQIG